MMEGVDNWFELAVQNSLNVPHPADVDSTKTGIDGKPSDSQLTLTPFRIHLKSLEILPSSVASTLATPYEVQLAATLFNGLYRKFYGRTTFTRWHRGKMGTDGFFRVTFNEPLYCHLPLKNDQDCLVVQTIFRSGDDREDREERANGWTVIKLKAWTDKDDIRKAISNRHVLYHGSPRALLFLNEPLESTQKAVQVASAGLFVDLKYHQPMFAVIQYLPECTLFKKGDRIGGIEFGTDPNDDVLQRAIPQSNRKNILIENVEIDMEPSIQRFDDEICHLINKDRLEKQKNTRDKLEATARPDANSRVTVVERRLRVGIHNGYCYIQDPLILHLTSEQEDTGLSALSRKLSFKQTQRRRTVSGESRADGKAERQKLSLRNPIRLDDVPLDDQNTIVFVLEYMLSIPVGPPKKENEPIEFTKMIYTIRWAAWLPGRDKNVALKFLGGNILPSDELFVYKPSTSVVTNNAEVIQERLRFNYRFDTEPPSIYASFKSKSSDVLAPTYQRPPLPTSLPPSVHASVDYATVSRSATAPPRTIPSALQPPIYHQANMVPWQTEVTYPTYSPVSALANQTSFAHSLSRAAFARLQGKEFPTIKSVTDKDAEMIDIRQPRFLNMDTEMVDPLNSNQLHFHFLAYFKTTRTNILSSKATYPKSLYFTFKFYRFGETTTSRVMLERLHENISNDPNLEPYILWRLKEDSTKTQGLPGLPVKFQVDGAYLGSVEQRQFFEYLDSHFLYIEVWDGDGLFPIGMCGLELRYLLRDGRPAIQALVELDVYSSSTVDSSEMPEMDNPYYQSPEQQFSLAGERLKIVGKLVMRIGNVGSVGSSPPSIEKLKTSDALRLLPTSRIIASGPPFDVVQSRVAEITTAGVKDHHLTKAHRIVEAYPNLTAVLHNPDKQVQDAERQRKLARMEAVRKRAAETGAEDLTSAIGTTNRKMRELREIDLKAISMYRHQTKHEDISHHLMKFITREVNVRLMPGYVEFFEFVLQNPYPEQHSISIACNDDELSVVTDSREWQRLKTLFAVTSRTEDNMFSMSSGMTDQSGLKYPQIFMQGKESVHVPFKLQTFLAKFSPSEQKATSSPFEMEETYSVVEKNYNHKFRPKQIKAEFLAEDGTSIAILLINVEYMSPIVDQTIRCINGENTLLKRVFRVPNPRRAITTESLSTGLPEQVHQVFVRASDTNIVCEVQPVPVNQPCNMLIKAASHNAPTVNSFLVFMYSDGYLHKPIHVWQFQIHAVKRLDLTCVQYQPTTATLLLRGRNASRLVQCFGNFPDEMLVSPSNAFSLAANGLHEVHLRVCPVRSGFRTYNVNAVDVENHQIVDTWMIKVDTRMPVISKQFAHTIPIGESQPIHKRISYTNPYNISKTFYFMSSHPELLQLQHERMLFQSNEKKFLNFTLLPAFNVAPVTDIFILINNEEGTNEDAYVIRVNYTDPRGLS